MTFLLTLLLAAAATTAPYDAFDAILRERVTDGLVDYAAIKKNDAPKLTAYLDTLAIVDAKELPRDEQLAYYINLYNATMIRAIVDRLRHGYSPAENDYGVFKEKLVRLAGGKTISLNDLEHEIIRKQLKDPRIHVALVCGARSCPPLLSRAYREDDLDKTLDENMRRFVADPSRNQIDDKKKELRLSKIFDWYADDFGGKAGVVVYVGRIAGKDLSSYRISFLDYDWTLNAKAP